MSPGDLLRFVAAALDRVQLPYFVTGSTATILYGQPRLTNDIDVVVRLEVSKIGDFCAQFEGDEFYLAPETVQRAVESRGSFNVIHPSSGLKVDFMVAADTDFNRSRFARARELEISGEKARFASPEDVILKKLEYFREGGSEKHLRDIAGVLEVSGSDLDFDYLNKWAEALNVTEEWQRVTRRSKASK